MVAVPGLGALSTDFAGGAAMINVRVLRIRFLVGGIALSLFLIGLVKAIVGLFL